jgi:hypothetical protein
MLIETFRFTVILAWITGKPLTLMFDPLESITLFLAGKGHTLNELTMS